MLAVALPLAAPLQETLVLVAVTVSNAGSTIVIGPAYARVHVEPPSLIAAE